MNTSKILKEWPRFRKGLDSAIRSDRLMKINFDFNLHPDFHKKDLDEMIEAVNSSLKSIRIIQEELQRG